MGPERVRGADGDPRRHGGEHARGCTIVGGHDVVPRRELRAEGNVPPDGERPEQHARASDEDDEAAHRAPAHRSWPAALHARGSEHGAGDQSPGWPPRCSGSGSRSASAFRRGGSARAPGRAVAARSGESSGRPARGASRSRRYGRSRCSVAASSEAQRMGHRRPDDPGRRAADRGVAACERRPAAGGVVRHDHRGRDDGDRGADDRDHGARAAPAVRDRVPEPSIATTRPTCSFVRHAAPAQSANGSSRSSSRNQIAPRSSGVANATGWKSSTTSHCVGG